VRTRCGAPGAERPRTSGGAAACPHYRYPDCLQVNARAFKAESIRQHGARQCAHRIRREPLETPMNRQPSLAVRAIAAAFAAFMTAATLDAVVSIAEPQQSQLIAAIAARQGARMTSTPQRAVLVARASTSL